jgi:hypothetical protein
VRTCAWCKRVWLDGWMPLEEALSRLGASRLGDAGRVTHGICEECLEAQLVATAAAKQAA